MGPMILQRQVLPPRQAPREPHDLVSEAQVRAAIARAIWTLAALVVLMNVVARMLGTGL
jgi:hypothetical protein